MTEQKKEDACGASSSDAGLGVADMYYTPKNLIDLLQAKKQADKYIEVLGNPTFSIRTPNTEIDT